MNSRILLSVSGYLNFSIIDFETSSSPSYNFRKVCSQDPKCSLSLYPYLCHWTWVHTNQTLSIFVRFSLVCLSCQVVYQRGKQDSKTILILLEV